MKLVMAAVPWHCTFSLTVQNPSVTGRQFGSCIHSTLGILYILFSIADGSLSFSLYSGGDDSVEKLSYRLIYQTVTVTFTASGTNSTGTSKWPDTNVFS